MPSLRQRNGYSFRQVTAADGEAIRDLTFQSPDTGMISVARHFEVDPLVAVAALKPQSVGVVAQEPGGELAGAGFVTPKMLDYAGECLPTAYLSNLVVHPHHRRRGIAAQLAAWRLECVNELLGEGAVTFAFIQNSNRGSFATAKSWARQQLGPITVAVVPPRTRAPSSNAYRFREAGSADYEQVSARQDSFYREFLFYPRLGAHGLAAWLSSSPLEALPIRRYYVVESSSGELVAGAAVSEQWHLATDYVLRMPQRIAWANAVLKVIPPEGVLRTAVVSRFWFEPGHLVAARYLWASIRYGYRDEANTVRVEFDPRSPLSEVIGLPFYWPTSSVTAVVNGPQSLPEDKPIYAEI